MAGIADQTMVGSVLAIERPRKTAPLSVLGRPCGAIQRLNQRWSKLWANLIRGLHPDNV